MNRIKGSILFFLGFLPFIVSATHLKAGELTASYVGGYTYRFNLKMYTSIEAINGNPNLDLKTAAISINGVPADTVFRTNRNLLDAGTYENVFVFEYSFPGSGVYVIGFSEDNRNGSILNINGGNSVNVPFFIETYILVSPLAAKGNSSPVLMVPPIDKANVGEIYTHNPGAFDPEGDSLSYKLVAPKQANNTNVPNYTFPEGLSLNPNNGDLVWDSPKVKGLYNIAILIEEYRNNIRIGYVMRDMQIEVFDTLNHPPVLQIPDYSCLIAGASFQDTVSAIDPDGDKINLSAYGGAFSFSGSSATFNLLKPNPQDTPAIGAVAWQTNCTNVRNWPFQFIFLAEDVPVNSIALSDQRSLNIKVLGSPVELVSAVSQSSSIVLNWKPYTCSSATRIEIYRRACDSLPLTPDPCVRNTALLTGYEKIDEVPAAILSYTDTNKGRGLKQGSQYCYLLRAKYPAPGNGESILSKQICAVPSQNKPVPLNASVLATSTDFGKVFVAWAKPLGFDTAFFPSPYIWLLKRSFQKNTGFSTIATLHSLNDTTYIDSLVNTTKKLFYVVEFVSANQSFSSDVFSTVALKASPGSGSVFLNWDYNVPWSNAVYDQVILRRKKHESKMIAIKKVHVLGEAGTYTDAGLSKKDTLCYSIKTIGKYCIAGFPDSLVNYSQEQCLIPVDSSKPCPPVLFLTGADCEPIELASNKLSWIPNRNAPCNSEIAGFHLYFSPRVNSTFDTLFTIKDTLAEHKNSVSLAGCYQVSAFNIYGIESDRSNIVCTDICTRYELPNLITPNHDGQNDYFRPLPTLLNVEEVNFSVYNRWGGRVFHFVGDPQIDWRGVNTTGEALPDGIYFYKASVRSKRRLNAADDVSEIKGWVQILSKIKTAE